MAGPPLIRFGTSSWNYEGWIGQVYSKKHRRVGEYLAEYVRHPAFSSVGIDSTFYRPVDENQMREWAAVMPDGFKAVVKCWDHITAPHFHKNYRVKNLAGQDNPDFLNPDLFMENVAAPLAEGLGDHLGPIVLEFQRMFPPSGDTRDAFLDKLNPFLASIPDDLQLSVEVRNKEFLHKDYFTVLHEHNAAHVFNYQTTMPPIAEQLDHEGSITADFIVARVLTAPGVTHAVSNKKFSPFNEIQEPNKAMRADVVRLCTEAETRRFPGFILVNNRAEGNAPDTIRALQKMVEQKRRTRSQD